MELFEQTYGMICKLYFIKVPKVRSPSTLTDIFQAMYQYLLPSCMTNLKAKAQPSRQKREASKQASTVTDSHGVMMHDGKGSGSSGPVGC